MSGGYASKKNMASGRAVPIPTPQPKIRSMTIGSGEAGRFNTRLKMNQKEKKMNFIKRKLRDWLFETEYADEAVVDHRDDADISDHENSINFNVINAAGGRIVQVRFYDRKTDRHSNKLHIITPEENLAESLAHILAIETMSR